jgi:hypothetical protein
MKPKEMCNYTLVKSIPPISNAAKGLFGTTKSCFGLYRQSLSLISIKSIIFLRANSDYKDLDTVVKELIREQS